PQRHLADALGVTVGTVTRGYAEAEHRGWVTARVGSGTYVKPLQARHVFDTLHERESGLTDLSLSLPPPHPLRAQALSTALQALSSEPDVLKRGITYSGAQGSEHHRQL
ncbi:GntR family transcriptional regulator, partial [Guyparkeria sp. 1SP6A2]|nr:GntR family transcriptional regulator [Guyparkeria sp. 1SP6A2]